jgi:hypothetical protein
VIAARCAAAGAAEDLPIDRLVNVVELKPNPDYPHTTPQGGTGKGIPLRNNAAAGTVGPGSRRVI